MLPVHFLCIMQALQPQTCRNMTGLGSSHFARHYSGNHYYFLFLRVLRCFSSPGSPPIARIIPLHGIGLSHSETCGSIPICGSPQLIAAYCVLHRLWEPRHSPYALIYFLVCLCSNYAIAVCITGIPQYVWTILSLSQQKHFNTLRHLSFSIITSLS
jgi:hypothetical protein